MEPFISTSYDGPQIDDIISPAQLRAHLRAQRHLPPPATVFTDIRPSAAIPTPVNGQADADYSATPSPPRHVAIFVTPIGARYLDGPQNSTALHLGTTYKRAPSTASAVSLIAAEARRSRPLSPPCRARSSPRRPPSPPALVRGRSARQEQRLHPGYTSPTAPPATPGLVMRLPSGPPQRVSPTPAQPSTRASPCLRFCRAQLRTVWYRVGTGAYQGVPMTGRGRIYTAAIPAVAAAHPSRITSAHPAPPLVRATYPTGSPAGRASLHR